MDDAAVLSLMRHLALAAGEVIERVRAAGFAVTHKPDESPVTAADHAAEAVIVDGLRAACPHTLIVAEEACANGHDPEPCAEYFLVDPLDGTREFAAGRDSFAVNIALVRDGEPVLGVVASPASGAVWYASPDGAFRDDHAGTIRLCARAPVAGGLVMLASRGFARTEDLPSLFPDEAIAAIERSGSSLKFCRLAEGAADVYPRLGRTMEWDTAAPQAILQAAGGSVRTLDGRPLRYGKPGWENPWFIARGQAAALTPPACSPPQTSPAYRPTA